MPANLIKTNYIPTTFMQINLLFVLCLFFFNLTAQDIKKSKHWGIHFGYSTQQTVPFHSYDYDLEQGHVLGQLRLKNYTFKKVDVQFLAEGGYYYAQHQLINKWFTSSEFFNHFPENFHHQMLLKKPIHQVVFHAAVEIAHYLNPKTQVFGYAAIGPMWTSQLTERLAKGFAFSDNIGVGVKFKLSKKMWLSNMVIIRHESNVNLKFPNSGHNTLGVRLGVIFNLTAPQKGVAPPSSL